MNFNHDGKVWFSEIICRLIIHRDQSKVIELEYKQERANNFLGSNDSYYKNNGWSETHITQDKMYQSAF